MEHSPGRQRTDRTDRRLSLDGPSLERGRPPYRYSTGDGDAPFDGRPGVSGR
ncbi:hypothetical protein [Natronococcus wangiae]|uniref:hypothetical protein n=1 Tax=Natronococcus wangiae TaxID=3068275 RepID=UPI00273F6374|nr:hypothetical protein [Natronococcus sp. AD5]